MEPVSVESSPVTYRLQVPRAPGAPRKPKLQQRSWGFTSESESESGSEPETEPESESSLSPIVPTNLNLSWNFHEPEQPSESSFRTFSMTMASPSPLPLPLSLHSSPPQKESIGDCSICYDQLFPRENHVFTKCGHLFCVKCFLRWSDTSLTCPMCRREMVEPGQEQGFNHEDEYVDQPSQYTYSYLHMEEDAELVADTSFQMQTDPEHGDHISNLTDAELELIQYNRLVVSCVFLRNRFHDTLFSNTTWGGMVQHTLIPKSEWLHMWENVPLYTQRAPVQMFEFVLRRNSQSVGYRRPNEELNTFGYITNSSTMPIDEEEGSQLAFAFDVMVVSPTVPLGYHNITEGRIETTLLTIPFEDIRRLYYVTSVETYEV